MVYRVLKTKQNEQRVYTWRCTSKGDILLSTDCIYIRRSFQFVSYLTVQLTAAAAAREPLPWSWLGPLDVCVCAVYVCGRAHTRGMPLHVHILLYITWLHDDEQPCSDHTENKNKYYGILYYNVYRGARRYINIILS